MAPPNLHKALTLFIAAVWFVNGLLCKVLNLVPRHEQIVARILGNEYARQLTIAIGIAEVVMAVWVLSAFKAKYNAIVQIALVSCMNILEYIFAPDLLLWGRGNILFASVFIGVIFYNEFILKKRLQPKDIR
ncbi:MAG: DoxX-like family protein [Chitinophagales bacterium]|nr:DoxX-like family protein [Chitinophagales bacterium]MDW8419283.1 DoxX-like family protein [Chitinophagales bacterium]